MSRLSAIYNLGSRQAQRGKAEIVCTFEEEMGGWWVYWIKDIEDEADRDEEEYPLREDSWM